MPDRWVEPYPVGKAPGWFPNKDRDGAIRAMRRGAKAKGYTLGSMYDVPPERVLLRNVWWRIAYVAAPILTRGPHP